MERPNPIKDKSYQFAIAVVRLCRELMDEKREFIMSKQLCRSGTSIAANIEEALHAPSKKDFANKLSIALKEAFESHYWIRLIRDTGYVTPERAEQLLKELGEILALLTSIIKTSRKTLVS